MAILIQAMVPADAAGVCFTAHPVTGARNELVLSAVGGVGDRHSPVRWTWEKRSSRFATEVERLHAGLEPLRR
jgi:hypothetical protein